MLLSRIIKIKASLAFIALIGLFGLSCGKRSVPLPPIERVSQRAEISGSQRGNIVVLSWTLPARNAENGSVKKIDHVDIYRLIEPLSSPQSLTEENFASRSNLIGSVAVGKDDFSKQTLSYSDPLEFAGQNARLRYAIRFVNESGQKAAFSNFLLIEPTSKVADKPINLTAEITEEAVRLKWDAPSANVDGSVPANILGYNIYRNIEQGAPTIQNQTPQNTTEYSDKLFQFGAKYSYYVRTVSLGNDGQPIESFNSNTVGVAPKDIFPPSPPTAITIAAAPQNLAIFFAVNPEGDVAGYKIYRTTDPEMKKSEWELLTPELLKTNTFRDANVQSNKTYYYYLIAVDNAGNASEPSEVVSETAP